MKGEQLNLFEHVESKPTAEIIAFPVNREAALVRETARILTIKQGAAADRFWQMTRRRLYARLQVQGMVYTDIQAEIHQFASAVFAQLQIHDQAGNPKGAA